MANEQMTRLKRDNAMQRLEIAHLRSRIGVHRRGSTIVRRAHADALALLQERYMGRNTGRVEMARQGMSKRRWAWAVALLRYAGVVSTRTGDWRYGLRWVASEIDAMRLLADANDATLLQLKQLVRSV